MGAAAVKRTIQGLTVVAKKVYDVVPINEPWSLAQIHSELVRQGHNLGHVVIDGCLKSLRADHVIKEPKVGFYIKVAIKEKVAEKPLVTEFADTSKKVIKLPEKRKESIVSITKLSELVESAKKLSSEFSQFTEQLETAIIELDDEVKDSSAAAAQLAQLKSLLKGL